MNHFIPAILFLVLTFAKEEDDKNDKKDKAPRTPVTYGSTIKLQNVATKHRLHSHDIPYGLLLNHKKIIILSF